jgi:hypothetical protein
VVARQIYFARRQAIPHLIGRRPKNVQNGYRRRMEDRERSKAETDEAEHGNLAVPGDESHEADDTLSPDERGAEDEPVPPPSEPKQA